MSLNSTLIGINRGKAIRYTNLAFLNKASSFDGTSICAAYDDLMQATSHDPDRVKSKFLTNRAKDLKRISYEGLLNHQLLPEEGGLGILTPSER